MGRPTSFDLSALENLAERIYHGQVVFFVGAGFSLDSEGLTGRRLLLRLLARFDAITTTLLAGGHGPEGSEREGSGSGRLGSLKTDLRGELASTAKRLREVLRDTFGLGREATDPLTSAEHARVLEADYYRPNEWMCEAFGTLLDRCVGAGLGAEFWAQVHERERELLERNPIWGRVERLQAIEPRLLLGPRWGPSERGKALFLDTLGFADLEVMAGRPHAPALVEVERSFGERLRPRHHIIARWAREGLCRTLLTTNYDKLLEGAYRLSGFACRTCDVGGEPEQPPMLTELSHFARIGEAVDFFRFGHTHRSVLVAKIHGCAECYMLARKRVVAALESDDSVELERARRSFAHYLPAVVFTFREIQNWRRDAWSRDLLANLLRTRSIVFCGYSTRDRVLHDAFRTAFEEIATVNARTGAFDELRERRREPGPSTVVTATGGAAAGAGAAIEASLAQVDSTTSDRLAQRARAFFLGGPGALEFDALEVLRAASRAEGIDHPAQTHHPNYLQFHFEGDSGPNGFPGLDQTMRWLWHRSLRIRQEQSVEFDLRRVASGLLGHGCPERERLRVLERLRELTAGETEVALGWQRHAPTDGEFDRIVGWTDRFHVSLLRELALGESLLRRDGPGISAAIASRAHWFFPPSERPDWTGWGVVVEIGLRRMIAAWRGLAGLHAGTWRETLAEWAHPGPLTSPAYSLRPAVAFSRGSATEPSTPHALAIVLTGFDRRTRHPRVNGAYAGRVHHWRLRAQTIPWWTSDQLPFAGTPSAPLLWRWVVAAEPDDDMLRTLPDLLGIVNPIEAGQSRPLRVA